MKINTIMGVLDSRQLTIYKTDGTKETLLQGDPRIQRIVDEAAPYWLSNEPVEVDLSYGGDIPHNVYSEYEEKSNGFVKFFRVAKKKLKELFDAEPEKGTSHIDISQNQKFGEVPVQTPVVNETEIKMSAAVSEIMANAVPASHVHFDDENTTEQDDDTIVAVVDGEIIEDAQNLKLHYNRANKLGSATAVNAFMARISKVIEKRRHSMEDLMKFMERGDLPIAEDGSIIIFKRLESTGAEGVFVDVHSRKVEQRVGSFVVMDESLVDPNRHNECSTGLHVARRQYLRNFSGDVCVIAKVAPEDVIAVPQYDANKMRVCAYHILFRLSQEAMNAVCNNRSFAENEEACQQLAKALSGDHIERIEEVRITGQKGTGIVITSLVDKPNVDKTQVGIGDEQTKPLDIDEAVDSRKLVASVDPLSVIEKLKKSKQEAALPAAVPPSRNERALKLFNTMLTTDDDKKSKEAASSLLELKKKSKVSWVKLGFEADFQSVIDDVLEVTRTSKISADPDKGSESKATPTKKPKAEKAATKRVVNGVDLGTGSYKQRIQNLYPCTSVGKAQAILLLKKQSKKSWEYLGLTEAQAEEIKKLAAQ